MQAKKASATQSVISVVALPHDSNQYGYVYGGTVMGLVDQAAYAAAIRHARMPVVTVCVDHLTFLKHIHIGDIITVRASVNYVGHTSMEVGVRVETERMTTGVVEHVGSAYLTMVALGEDGKPASVSPLIVETEDEIRRQNEAQERRAYQLSLVGKNSGTKP
ncbi:MAG: acyl-CoA thioesterase [bacterium]